MLQGCAPPSGLQVRPLRSREDGDLARIHSKEVAGWKLSTEYRQSTPRGMSPRGKGMNGGFGEVRQEADGV